MKWLTSKRQVKILYAIAALVVTCGAAMAASDSEQFQRFKDPNQWGAPAGNLNLTRYSTLKDINTGNVKELQMTWSQSSGTLRGHEGQPLVIENVGGKPMMYIESGWPNIVQALDLSDPDHPVQMWNYTKTSGRDESAVPRACCDTVNRGLSYAEGKLVFGTLDGYVIALDAITGKEIWVVKNAHPDKGETLTPAPIIANDKVIIGFGGDEFAARGRITAYNLADGKKVWECHSTGSDKDVCLTPNTNKKHPEYGQAGKDLGISTYPGDEWKRGGGTAWGWYAYDPALHLVYYGTGNPGLWSPSYRCNEPVTQENCNTGKSDNKWSMSIFARNVDTGEAEWVYQMTPFDQWDYDGINEPVLVDMPIDGKTHKTLVHFDRNGFAYVLDRTDGTLLRAHKYVTVNWAEKVDLKTGRPIKVPEHSPLKVGVNTQVCPSSMGGKDQQPVAVDPTDPTNFYVPTNNWCMESEPQGAFAHPARNGLRIRQRLHVSGETRCDRQVQEVQRGDRQDRVGNPGPVPELGWSAGHRRRIGVLWQPRRRFPCRRPRDGQSAVVAQTGLRRHRQPDHVFRERQAVRVRVVGHRRLDRSAGDSGPGS